MHNRCVVSKLQTPRDNGGAYSGRARPRVCACQSFLQGDADRSAVIRAGDGGAWLFVSTGKLSSVEKVLKIFTHSRARVHYVPDTYSRGVFKPREYTTSSPFA